MAPESSAGDGGANARPGTPSTGGVYTSGRDTGRKRARGYVDWRPRPGTRALIDQANAVLDEYADYLPLTVRQVFYRLVGAHGYEKTERAWARLGEHLVRARRARLIPFESIRDDGVIVMRERWFAEPADSGTTSPARPATTGATSKPASSSASSCGARRPA